MSFYQHCALTRSGLSFHSSSVSLRSSATRSVIFAVFRASVFMIIRKNCIPSVFCEAVFFLLNKHVLQVIDLLAATDQVAKALRVREHPKTGPFLEYLTKQPVATKTDLQQWIQVFILCKCFIVHYEFDSATIILLSPYQSSRSRISTNHFSVKFTHVLCITSLTEVKLMRKISINSTEKVILVRVRVIDEL